MFKVSQGVRTSPVVKRHRQDGVRRLCAHPHLPLYLSGGQDGSVLLWEWSHNQHVRRGNENKELVMKQN